MTNPSCQIAPNPIPLLIQLPDVDITGIVTGNTLVYNTVTKKWTAGSGGGSGTVTSVGVSSTDLSVSGSPVTTSGTITLNINSNAVTFAKIQQIATSRLLGRSTAGTGNVEELTIGSGLSLAGGVLSASGSGTVTSVSASGGTTGLSFTGSPITTSGTITLTGTLAVANGGTGVTTSTGANSVMLRDANGNTYINNIPNNLTTTVTSGGTLTLTVSSAYNQLLTGSSGHTVVLPVASTLTVGHSFYISNNSSGTVVIQSSGGNTVTTLIAFQSALVTCVLASGTTAASWSPRLLLLSLTTLSNWTESTNTYSSQVGVRFLATNAGTNVDAVISPKGTGAFYLGAYADGTGTAGNGGNNRGPYAADLQIYRNAANQVASGYYSFTVGFGNRAANTSSIAMGFLSVSSADYAIAIGQSCTASATNAVSIGNSNTVSTAQGVGIGRSNTVSGGGLNYAFGDNNSVAQTNASNQSMALGAFNTITSSGTQSYALGAYANISAQGVAIGQTNTVSATGGFAGGENNTSSGNYSLALGRYASSILYGKYAYAGGRITNTGDRQYSKSLLKCQSTSTTPVEAFLDNSSARLSVANNSVYSFTITATAIKSDNTAGATFVRSGAIRKTTTSGSTVLIGSVQTIGTDQSDFGSTPAIVISADTTHGALKMTGASGTTETINWLFNVELTEISN